LTDPSKLRTPGCHTDAQLSDPVLSRCRAFFLCLVEIDIAGFYEHLGHDFLLVLEGRRIDRNHRKEEFERISSENRSGSEAAIASLGLEDDVGRRFEDCLRESAC
jgi:hypothetical protein